jgi:hypothetical protein
VSVFVGKDFMENSSNEALAAQIQARGGSRTGKSDMSHQMGCLHPKALASA